MYQLHQDPYTNEISSVSCMCGHVRLSIPPDPANTDYQAYLAWLKAGNTPEPAPEPEVTWDSIRAKRDQIIRDTDYTMIPGATLDQAQWAAYRQILRDLPQTFAETGPESVIWPEPPSTAGPNTPAT